MDKVEETAAESILKSVPDGLYTVDDDMKIRSFNPAAEKITGFQASEVLGRKCCDIFKTGICTTCCPVREAMDTGRAIVNREMDFTTKDNRKIPVSVSASVLRNASGEAVGGVKSFRDIFSVHLFKHEIRKKYTFRDLVSRNQTMWHLFDILPDVATTDATVLLTGESGTGKELFTRAVHELSARREGPLVVINCGALPEPLLEAEIFGARKGAYTGAVENRPGRLEVAQGGTLFLDEIGDLPLPLQVKLLRVLENREYQPLGGKHPQKADVRFVAATHRNLATMVEEGTFRRDLFFRINVVSIDIPPLRDRKEDIPLLIDTALERFNLRYGKKIRDISAEALQVLLQHDYPGNVRELMNIVEQSVILCRNGEIRVEDLPPGVMHAKPQGTAVPGAAAGDEESHRFSMHQIEQALQRHNGNKTEVARELGIDRTTLWRWLKRHQKSGFAA